MVCRFRIVNNVGMCFRIGVDGVRGFRNYSNSILNRGDFSFVDVFKASLFVVIHLFLDYE